MSTPIEVENTITVGALADKLMIPVTKLIGELMKNGVMVTVNERIDFDTAQIIVGELGLEVELVQKEDEPVIHTKEKRHTDSKTAQERPPVVAVMGHVDHGKTSLLDAIRESDVTKGEAGGITQHISAYQITHNKRKVTFLDTPGHEAFAALREHGAQLTDLAIIVIAADDGIKPQTQEAIRFAQKAGVKMIFALNKIDKPEANPDRVKQQLAEQNLMPEDWGGDTIVMPVSAKSKQGIPELLDMVLLVADVEELKAEVKAPAKGLIIEAHVEQGRGPVAIALIEVGTLKSAQFVVIGSTYGKLRTLEDTEGNILKEAGPSTPIVMSGLRSLPEFGDEFEVVANEKVARAMAEKNQELGKDKAKASVSTSSDLLKMINRNRDLQELNVIVKADVQGSLTSVIDSLKTLEHEEVAVRIVGSGVGAINETDLHMAQTSNAIIYGFSVSIPANVRQTATRDKISVRLYNVIYELIDDAKEELTKMLVPEVVETELGRLVVRGVFKTTKTEIICGGEVTKGKLTTPALARITRGDDIIADNIEVSGLKRGPQEAKEVIEGEMCGLQLATISKIDVQEGDRIELFTRESVARKL